MFIYFLREREKEKEGERKRDRERERGREHKRGRSREREGDTESKAGSRLQALSCQHRARRRAQSSTRGLNSQTVRS